MHNCNICTECEEWTTIFNLIYFWSVLKKEILLYKIVLTYLYYQLMKQACIQLLYYIILNVKIPIIVNINLIIIPNPFYCTVSQNSFRIQSSFRIHSVWLKYRQINHNKLCFKLREMNNIIIILYTWNKARIYSRNWYFLTLKTLIRWYWNILFKKTQFHIFTNACNDWKVTWIF